MFYDFHIFCSISIPPTCFHLSPISRLLTSKIRTVKKIKNCKKDFGQLRASYIKGKEILCEIQRFVV